MEVGAGLVRSPKRSVLGCVISITVVTQPRITFFPAASKLDASESASEQEEDFELISDEELRSATNEEEDDLENERDKIK